ncbi:MAG TPA: VWA domain-containing protein [Vicinamibacterales bacterium]|nr:VWA domain-containing protein [Vicinamibacterales bacterium]
MPAVTWTSPAALWLLLAVPIVFWLSRHARTTFNPRQRRLQSTFRAAILASIALALARPVIGTRTSRTSVVYAVDVSHSIGSPAIERAAGRIDELNASLSPSHWRIVAFGGRPHTVPSTEALRKTEDGATDRFERGGTDLERALEAARTALAPGHIPRIVLFTDGRDVAGDAREAVRRLAAAGIPLSVEPLAPRTLGDTWIDAVRVPERVTAGAMFTAAIEVASQRETTATVSVRARDGVLASRTVPLPRGRTTVPLDVQIDTPGTIAVDASVEAAGDPLRGNDSLAREVHVEARPRVLYAEGTPRGARYLTGALTASGFDVTAASPGTLPRDPAGLSGYDVVILSDIAARSIPPASMSAIETYVERDGGGLLIAGGDAVFGEEGYKDTALERVAPVTFERRDATLALVIVLDRSWSMAGPAMNLSKAAAQAAVDVMTDEQAVGIITFNEDYVWDVTVRNVGRNRESIRQRIAAIEPAGRTLIYPALEQAYLALRAARARTKHVVLLSDGRTYPDKYEELVGKMVKANITVSAIAVGPAADQELLRSIAAWGKGQQYAVADARELPQVFVKEARDAANEAFDERSIKPVMKVPGFFGVTPIGALPPLKGRTATTMKNGAMEVVATDDDEPVLAFWPAGAGRTAVFASDVKDRWGANWVGWRGYGPFFATLVRSLQRQTPPPLVVEVTPGPVRRGAVAHRVAIEARDQSGGLRNLLRPEVTLDADGRRTAATVARQVAPGRYEADVIAPARRLTVGVRGLDGTSAATRFVLPDPMAEYRFRDADLERLHAFADATGGAFRPAAETLRQKPTEHPAVRRPVSGALLLLALLCWFADILARRVRVFE